MLYSVPLVNIGTTMVFIVASTSLCSNSVLTCCQLSLQSYGVYVACYNFSCFYLHGVTYVWEGTKSNRTTLTNKLLNIVILCNDNDAIKYMSIKEACNHQCAKCGVLYDCGGCIEPFFTRKHDCKLQSTIYEDT